MNPIQKSTISIFSLLPLACGAAPSESADVPSTETPSEVGETSEAITNCLAIQPDVSCTINNHITGEFRCDNVWNTGNYGRATCPNTAIMDLNVQVPAPVSPGYNAFVGTLYKGPILKDGSVFPCSSMWYRQRIVDVTTSRTVDERTLQSVQYSDGTCSEPWLDLNNAHVGVPNGQYRVMSSAWFITTTEPLQQFSFANGL